MMLKPHNLSFYQDAFRAGQHFAQNFPASMSRINNLEENHQKSQVDSDSDSEHQAERLMAAASAGGRQSVIPNMLAGFHLSKKYLVGSKAKGDNKDSKKDEVSQFMRGIMDECTHLKNFSVPINTELIIAIAAMEDAYVPRDDCTHLQDIWPGASIRFLKGGHVSSFLLYINTFR